MRKKVGIVKRMLCLLLIFLLSINSFGAIVSDNDGSAFITKAEFDALKSSFQSQIDSYNNSIDSKIDGAIASYLAGIKLASTVTGTSCVYEISQLPLHNLKNFTSWYRLAAHERLSWGMNFFYTNSLSFNGNGGSTAWVNELITRIGPGTPAPFGFIVTGAGNSDASIGSTATPVFNMNCVWSLTLANQHSSGYYGTLATPAPSTTNGSWYHGDFFWYPWSSWSKTNYEYAKANHWKQSSSVTYDPSLIRYYNDGKSTTGKYVSINWPLFGFNDDEYFWCWDEGLSQYYQTVGTNFTPTNSVRSTNAEKNAAYVGHKLSDSERENFYTWAGHPRDSNWKLALTSGGSEDLPRNKDNNDGDLYQMSGDVASGKLPVLVTGSDAKIPIIFSDFTTSNSRKAYRYSFYDTRNYMRSADTINTKTIKTNVYVSPYGHGAGAVNTKTAADFGYYYNGYSSLDPRILLGTFGSIDADIDHKGDSVRSASKIKFKLNDLANPVSSGNEWTLEKGVPIILNNEHGKSVSFKIKFDTLWGNGSNYQMLLKKDDTWDYTKLGNKETIEYKINGSVSPTNAPVQISPGEYEIKIDNISENNLIYLQWLTDDDWDGGRLLSITDVVYEKDN